MQLVEAMCFAFALVAGASAVAQDLLSPDPAHRFAEAVLQDPSLRLTRKQAPRAHDADVQIQREVESMIGRLKTLHDSELTTEFAKELGSVEAALANHTSNKTFANEILAARADLCAELGFDELEFQDCDSFMRAACSPADRNVKIPQENCSTFFNKEAMALHAQRKAPGAPAPAAAQSPGSAAAPAPGPALFGGKSLRKLPEQGFHGKLVEHKDFDTHTGDWQKEFGPKAGHRTFDEICADNPSNEWCRLHGYGPKPLMMKSLAFSSRLVSLPVLAVLASAWQMT